MGTLDYLQLVAEAGWVGAVLLVVGFYLFLACGIWRVRRVGEVGGQRLKIRTAG